MHNETKKVAKPFLKWAGGKSQLLHEIKQRVPFNKDERFTYIEPFVGSGAVFFWILENCPNAEKVIINDVNHDLINAYQQISANVEELIILLKEWESQYHKLEDDEEEKKKYYYAKRSLFNSKQESEIVQAALLIFLNRTCFNGLFRVNSSNEFNVPVGSYKKPMIADVDNLRRVSVSMKCVVVRMVDFEQIIDNCTEKTFIYFDPPYKPLNVTSSFNSYSKYKFDDNEQIRLKKFCDELNKKGYKWLLSNSDPVDENGLHFFDKLYSEYHVERVQAARNINSKGYKRGKLDEVLIRNY